MALSAPQLTKLLVAAAAMSVAVGVGVAWNIGAEESAVTSAILDAGLSPSSGLVRMTDLLTAPIDPGATVHTSVTLPNGASVLQVVAPTPFTETHTTSAAPGGGSAAGVVLDVAATNTGSSAARFVGFVVFMAP